MKKKEYQKSVLNWIEIPYLGENNLAESMVWFYAGNYSEYTWEVYKEQGEVRARLEEESFIDPSLKPSFEASFLYYKGRAFQKVSDGWLVAFNEGEFGGHLQWFSIEGDKDYEISGHQVNQFLETSEGIFAIEGLAHLGAAEGSMIQIKFDKSKRHWYASTITKFNDESPEAFAQLNKNLFVIVSSESLMTVSLKGKVSYLIQNIPWGGLYPNSLVLSDDKNRVYIGMRQYVAEYDFQDSRIRFLVPEERFLNRFSKKKERQIRKAYERTATNPR